MVCRRYTAARRRLRRAGPWAPVVRSTTGAFRLGRRARVRVEAPVGLADRAAEDRGVAEGEAAVDGLAEGSPERRLWAVGLDEGPLPPVGRVALLLDGVARPGVVVELRGRVVVAGDAVDVLRERVDVRPLLVGASLALGDL